MLTVETFDLTKDYYVGFFCQRPKRALHRLNLRVEAGETFGLLGPNGARKTTALKILLRLVFPTAGTARVLGRGLDDVAMHARVGYLPENPYFYDHLTAEEFLNYAGELFGLPCSERRRRVGRLLEPLGVAEARHAALPRDPSGAPYRVLTDGRAALAPTSKVDLRLLQ